jgi:4-carboxymuconolactone decarboxylase
MRLEQLTLDDLAPDQRELYDAIVGSRTGSTLPARVVDEDGNVQGPFNAMLHYPLVGHPLQELGGVLRFRGGLPARARELVILIVAAAWESEFEWWAHVRIGKQVELTDDEIDAVRTSGSLALDDQVEQAAVDIARATTTRGDLDDDEYARARAALGDQLIIEVLTLVGYYALLALQMRVHRVPLPEGAGYAFTERRRSTWMQPNN